MANVLTHLQQFSFALSLYESVLENFAALGIVHAAELPKLHATIGGLYLQKEELEKAEDHLTRAITIDGNCLSAYENLVAVYASQKNEERLREVWGSLEPLLDVGAFNSEMESVASLLFNFGTAYALLMKDKLDQAGEQAVAFYERALAYDGGNWDVKLQLARVLVIKGDGLDEQGGVNEKWERAKALLEGFSEYGRELPFGVSPQQKFQVYFCLSGACALCRDIPQAQAAAIEAGKMRYNPDEVHNLQSHLQAFHQGEDLASEIRKQIVESIRRIRFSFRVGKVINKNSIIISGGSFMGYHGTIDSHVEELMGGVKPKKAAVRQFSGKGFYITTDREIACYFAKKKAIEEGRGNPVVLKIYATSDQGLVGQNIPVQSKLSKSVVKQYDFVRSYIDGFEAFPQDYVLENSLEKLRVCSQVDPVNWTDEKYQQFISYWQP